VGKKAENQRKYREIQGSRKPSVLVGFLRQKKDCAYTFWDIYLMDFFSQNPRFLFAIHKRLTKVLDFCFGGFFSIKMLNP
jgi:hypothetical protein